MGNAEAEFAWFWRPFFLFTFHLLLVLLRDIILLTDGTRQPVFELSGARRIELPVADACGKN